ncbi:signal peptidase I [Clostridium sp.]|uniref:signal peptidase I n=1 Tax=Clostridium sp. TaxID=1506 RepID=UPI002FC825E4
MKKLGFNFKDIVQTLGILLVILVLKTFVIDNAKVQGQSMYPTLNSGEHNDRVIIEKYKHYTKDYKRGDIIILKSDKIDKDILIKRIIGLPGETVEIKQGKVYVNNELLTEAYLPGDIITNPSMKVHVEDGHVFVLGDNRDNSTDSRMLGIIPIDDIIGKATFKFNILDFDFEKLR